MRFVWDHKESANRIVEKPHTDIFNKNVKM